MSGTYHRQIQKSVKSKLATYKTKKYEITTVDDTAEYTSTTKKATETMDNLDKSHFISEALSSQQLVKDLPNLLQNNLDNDEEIEEHYLFSEDSDTDEYDGSNISNETLNEKLRNWAISFNISHSAVTALLGILKLPNLPKSSRTLLRTPRDVTIKKMGSGNYWHNGLENCLLHYLRTSDNYLSNLELSFNVDGLPIYNSSKMEFWPILCSISNLQPMVVGIYCGTTKPPSVKEFMTPFVDELKHLLKNGISVSKQHWTISIRCFICDTPARAFVKGVVNFNAYSGCTRCTVVGEYSHESHRMSFPRTDLPRRTNNSFRERTDPDHHKEDSTPLEDLPIDMIKDFPVGDSLHLLHLGIMKRCLIGWREGKFKKHSKWSVHDTDLITNFLHRCKMPKEIHRAVRGLDTLAFWKGVEFRTFLLYIAPVILKDFLPVDVYQHFLMLFVAITICSSSRYSKYLKVAESLLEKYIDKYIDIYGLDSITSNVHSLCHLVDDVERFGELETFSAYQYENKLYKIKRLLRTGNNPLAQAAKRIQEIEISQNCDKHKTPNPFPIVKKQIKSNLDELKHRLPHCNEFFAHIEVNDSLMFNYEEKNRWFLTKNQIVKMKCATKVDNNWCLYGSPLRKTEDFFETPIKSSRLNIFMSTCEEEPAVLFPLADIECKLVAIQCHDTKVFIPLIHSLI
ncbi:hypothetical protein PPYR_00650 [Photinus pyralis]|nr:hypothetical protein PPYR_00650 [Photinus pyralis]